MDVTTQVLDGDAGVLVVLDGELDVNTVDVVRSALVSVEADSPAVITVDLSRVGFMDSTGLGVLIGALNRAQERGGSIRLAAPTHRVVRLLSLTGMDHAFEVVDSTA